MAGSILNTVGDIGSILAAYEKNQAEGRLAQGDAQQRQANAAANIYRTQADVALKGPTQSAKSAALGDQMANIQPFSWTGDTAMMGNIPVPQSMGGLSPANFGPATRKAGADLATLSTNRVSDPAFNIPAPPKLDPLPTSSGLDSVLGTAGLLSQLAKAAGGANGGGGDIGKLIQSILNRNKGGTVQGNKPQTGGGVNPSNPFDNSFTGFNGDEDGMDPNLWGGGPDGEVNTDEFVGQWPETGDPFAPFDPNLLGDPSAGSEDGSVNWWDW